MSFKIEIRVIIVQKKRKATNFKTLSSHCIEILFVNMQIFDRSQVLDN